MIRHLAGMVISPRSTLAALVRQPAWAGTWILILITAAACGLVLLTTDVGQQALVDERVRVAETFGGTIDDEAYAALQARPPWWIYVLSGGRTLLTPPVTVLTALGLWASARAQGVRAGFRQTLAIAVHATVVLALGQLVVTPLSVVRESLTTPLSLAAILPLVEDGTLAARMLGGLDLFSLWWMALIAIGLAVLTGRPAWRYGLWLAGIYFGLAAVLAGVIAATGGT